MSVVSLDFRICTDSAAAARASFAALSHALSVGHLPDALADHLRALAPRGQAAADLIRVAYAAYRHGGVTIIEARLTPGDRYLEFVSALQAECPNLAARFSHGWPILSQAPLAVSAAGGVGAA